MMYEQLAPSTKRKEQETHSLLHSLSDSDSDADTVRADKVAVYQSVHSLPHSPSNLPVPSQPTVSTKGAHPHSLSVTERAASSSNDQLLGAAAADAAMLDP